MADPTPPPYTATNPAEISVFFEGGRYVFKTDETLSIYAYDKDSPGKSNCDATCSRTWLPVTAPEPGRVLGDWTAIQRPDKIWQWAYKGKPVYTNVHDQPGKATGDGAEGGLWHIVNPS